VLLATDRRMQSNMRRIVVGGSSCAGKTTFSRRLAQCLALPHIELDALYWLPHWVPRPPHEFRALVAQAVAQEHWVVDGNYSAVRDLVWSRATTVVWLNYAFPLVFWRALTRTVRRGIRQEELFTGNRESLWRSFFSRESILWWVITTFRQRRRQYRALFNDPEWARLMRLEFCTASEAERFLGTLAMGGKG
jgi:adenylate kinase family enzyme